MKWLSDWESDLAKPSVEEWKGLASLLGLNARLHPDLPMAA